MSVHGDATVDTAGLGRRAAVLVARLAVAGPAGATRTELAKAVWGKVLPGSWSAALRNVATGVRRTLARAGAAPALSLLTTSAGYALRAPGGSRGRRRHDR